MTKNNYLKKNMWNAGDDNLKVFYARWKWQLQHNEHIREVKNAQY